MACFFKIKLYNGKTKDETKDSYRHFGLEL